MTYPRPSITRIDPCYRCGDMYNQTKMTSVAKVTKNESRRGWLCDQCVARYAVIKVLPIRGATKRGF